MSRLWEPILNIFNFIGDNSGCHQIPERCFTVKGYTFPICARCTGVGIGQITAVLLWLLGVRTPFVMSAVFAGIMLLDWSIQYFGILQSNNIRRFITGCLGGYGVWSGMITVLGFLVSFVI